MSLRQYLLYCTFCILLLSGWMMGAYAFSTTAHAQSVRHPGAFSAAKQAERGNGRDIIVFVHGVDAAASPNIPFFERGLVDEWVAGCDKYWQDVINYLGADHGTLTWQNKDFRTLQLYNADTGCTNGQEKRHSADLHSPEYASHCINYPEGYDSRNNGSWNEDLYHLSCVFAWYMFTNFAQAPSPNVAIIAHSMGGLIVHNAIYQVQHHASPFPSTLGPISTVVDFSSPHSGHNLNPLLGLLCFSLQCTQMDSGNAFVKEMTSFPARDVPDGPEWTLIGSECDQVVSGDSASFLGNIAHKIIYRQEGRCYDHTSILSDASSIGDAPQYRCDYGTTFACNRRYNTFPEQIGPRSLATMLGALWSINTNQLLQVSRAIS